MTVTSTIGCPLKSTPTLTTSTSCAAVTQSATALPAYASGACADGAAFSSACGCVNVKPSHKTLAASTVTVATYTTLKTSPTFIAKAVSGQYNGYYLKYAGLPQFTNDASQAEYYTVNATGSMFGGNGTYLWSNDASNCKGCYDVVYESEPDGSSSIPALTCKLGSTLQSDGSLSFSCKAPAGATVFQTCSPDGNNLDMGGPPDAQFFDCFSLKLGAFPVCS